MAGSRGNPRQRIAAACGAESTFLPPMLFACANRPAWLRQASWLWGKSGLVVAVSGALMGSAAAQELDVAEEIDVLKQLSGLNAAQRDMARSIDRVCPTLRDEDNANLLDEQAQDLRDVCARMVDTGRQALDLEGSTEESYGLSEEVTKNVLQRINGGDELQLPNDRVAEVGGVQIGNITSRLSAVRAGIAGPGLSLAGLSLDAGERVLALDDQAGYEILPAQWANGGFLSRLGVFATGAANFGDKDATGAAEGFDFETLGLTVGADYRFTDQLVGGLAFGYSTFDADFDTTPRSPSGQELENDTATVSAFGSYNWAAGPFVDAIASVGWGEYDSVRRIVINSQTDEPDENRTATGEFDSFHYAFAANAGYDIPIQALTLTPLARFEFIRAEIDGFTEQGADGLNLEFGDSDVESLTINLGFEADYAISLPFGVLVPSARAEYVHEFLDDESTRVVYAADPTDLSAFEATTEGRDEDYGIIGAGLAATFPAGWAAFVDWQTMVGLRNFDVHTVSLGLRKEF